MYVEGRAGVVLEFRSLYNFLLEGIIKVRSLLY
jgi:hypothetical protein